MGVLLGQHRGQEFLGGRVGLCGHLQGTAVRGRGHLTDQSRPQGSQDVGRGGPDLLAAAAGRSGGRGEGQGRRIASGEAEYPVAQLGPDLCRGQQTAGLVRGEGFKDPMAVPVPLRPSTGC